MLLTRDRYYTFTRVFREATFPFVLVPICSPDKTEIENLQLMDGVAWESRSAGNGTIGLDGRWTGGDGRVFFLLGRAGESHVVGFARRMIREGKAAEDWFAFRNDAGELLKENADRSREVCSLTGDGFTLPDGRRFQFEKAYTPAQNATQYGHVKGFSVREHLCNRRECHGLESGGGSS